MQERETSYLMLSFSQTENFKFPKISKVLIKQKPGDRNIFNVEIQTNKSVTNILTCSYELPALFLPYSDVLLIEEAI